MSDWECQQTISFKGSPFVVSMKVTPNNQLLVIQAEDKRTTDQWRGSFNAQYTEDLTHKTGNFKQFSIFANMLKSAIMKTTNAVNLDLLSFTDLDALRSKNPPSSGRSSTTSVTRKTTLCNKRYLILTYSVEFDRIHYPLPLNFMGKPDPTALQEEIQRLHAELSQLRSARPPPEWSFHDFTKLKNDHEALLQEKEELKRCFDLYRKEVKTTTKGGAIKEIRVLKGVVATLEENLAVEREKHYKQSSKKAQNYRDVIQELEECKANERNLKVRVKSLTNELALYRRPTTEPKSHRSRSYDRPWVNGTAGRSDSARSNGSVGSYRGRSNSVSRNNAVRSRSGSYSRDDYKRVGRPIPGSYNYNDRSRSNSACNRVDSSPRSDYVLRGRSGSNGAKPASQQRARRPRSMSSDRGVSPRFDPTAYVRERQRRMEESRRRRRNGYLNDTRSSAGSQCGTYLSEVDSVASSVGSGDGVHYDRMKSLLRSKVSGKRVNHDDDNDVSFSRTVEMDDIDARLNALQDFMRDHI